jgi:hypothetical protein
MYADEQGETHFEDVEVPLINRSASGSSQISDLMKVTGIMFRRTGEDYDLDFHRAPRRQFIVNLTGGVELEVSDGEVRRFPPGSIILAEDTTGKGHKSKAIDHKERLSLFIPID